VPAGTSQNRQATGRRPAEADCVLPPPPVGFSLAGNSPNRLINAIIGRRDFY